MKGRMKLLALVVPLGLTSVALAMLAWLLTSGTAQAASCDVPTGTYPTIQSAVTDASCDAVNLTDALYVENVIITRSVKIQGQGALSTTVDGNFVDSVFTIQLGSVVTITGVTIINGFAENGGGILNDSDSSLFLNGVSVSSNSAGHQGGGIASFGKLSVTNSSFSDNSAASLGGGILIEFEGALNNVSFFGNVGDDGGGITHFGTLNVDNSTFSGNRANSWGGGIRSGLGSTLTINNSTFTDNRAIIAGGGAILNEGVAIIKSSNFNGNSAVWGGGVYNDSGARLAVINSTFSGNSAHTGGGIRNLSDGGTLTVNNSTFSGNSAITGGGIGNNGTVILRNSIVANSTMGGDCDGSVISLGHNLDSDNTCNLTATGDIASTNPFLGPLQDNGGPTWTHALLFWSPAIDAGDDGTCQATDQRGVARPQGAGCDIGSIETTLIIGAKVYLPVITSR